MFSRRFGRKIALSICEPQSIWCKLFVLSLLYLIDAKNTKICKKFDSDNGILRADQDRAKDGCQMDWMCCPVLWEPKKLSSEVGLPQLMEYKVIKKSTSF